MRYHKLQSRSCQRLILRSLFPLADAGREPKALTSPWGTSRHIQPLCCLHSLAPSYRFGAWGAYGNDGSFYDQDIDAGDNPAASAMSQSEVWVMMDQIGAGSGEDIQFFNHIPGGCNVLYTDGHAEFERFPGKSRVSRA
jgi:prepilin-type processing-associated H-X9-DG protein